jgi:dihydrofolate reductase
MRITTNTQVSVDGVMQGNGGRHPDIDPGFERGGWARPPFDDVALAYVNELYERTDAFLFGRRTFDLFASYWGTMPPGSGVIADAMNTKPKYVATTHGTDAVWAGTTVLSGDLLASIKSLKAAPGGELQINGSGQLIRWLFEHDLIDEFNLIVLPVIVGEGTRLFPQNGRDAALELISSSTTPNGLTLQTYHPNGRPQYAV